MAVLNSNVNSKPKSRIKNDVVSPLDRVRAEPESEGVDWIVHIAQQDAGMADIVARMIDSELKTANRGA